MNTELNIAVNDREELIYLLTEAAEFEHVVMCTYLYAQWSLKRHESEGISKAEKDAIDGWRASIRTVALEEMLHLALVNNLLAAFGAAPHFSRPDFPIRQGYFPSDLDFHLAPFNEQTIQHFVFIEHPEDIEVKDGEGFAHESHYQRVVCTDLLTPTARDYGTQGHLYHGIAQAIRRLARELGEDRLFVGHGEAQLSSAEFPLPGLFEVTGLETAMKALEEIVRQGEGAPAHREDSHYARFEKIRREHQALKQARPDFEAALPAAMNPVLTELADDAEVTRVSNSRARRVVDLGNSVYGLMLHTLAQVCAPAPLPSGLREGLSEVSGDLMRYLAVIGEAAVRLPICDDKPGINAGLSFALPRSFGQLVQANAAQILSERAAELADACVDLEQRVALPGVADGLADAAGRLAEMHGRFESHFTVMASPRTEPEQPAEARPATDDVPSSGNSDNVARSDEIEITFDGDRCIQARRCVLGGCTPKRIRSNTWSTLPRAVPPAPLPIGGSTVDQTRPPRRSTPSNCVRTGPMPPTPRCKSTGSRACTGPRCAAAGNPKTSRSATTLISRRISKRPVNPGPYPPSRWRSAAASCMSPRSGTDR
jgi:hypothetical protein